MSTFQHFFLRCFQKQFQVPRDFFKENSKLKWEMKETTWQIKLKMTKMLHLSPFFFPSLRIMKIMEKTEVQTGKRRNQEYNNKLWLPSNHQVLSRCRINIQLSYVSPCPTIYKQERIEEATWGPKMN